MGDVVRERRGAFEIIKYLAAFQVFFGHAFKHLHIQGNLDFFSRILSLFYGVPVFFCISGFLIMTSVEHCDNFKEYLKRRILRIFPELWICVVLELIAVIVFYREKINYLKLALFGMGQATLFQFWTPSFLRDYGCGVPNGSLWTITIILQFYILAILINKCQKVKTWCVLFFSSLLCGIVYPMLSGKIHIMVYKLIGITILPYLWLFMLGATVYIYRNKLLNILMRYWWIFLILDTIVVFGDFDIDASYPLLQCIFMGLWVFGFAYRFPKLHLKTDISYEFYLVHMIVINVFIELNMIGNWLILVISFIYSIAWGYIIYFINKNLLKKEKRKCLN